MKSVIAYYMQPLGSNQRIGQNFHLITLRNSTFSTSTSDNQQPLKCTKYL